MCAELKFQSVVNVVLGVQPKSSASKSCIHSTTEQSLHPLELFLMLPLCFKLFMGPYYISTILTWHLHSLISKIQEVKVIAYASVYLLIEVRLSLENLASLEWNIWVLTIKGLGTSNTVYSPWISVLMMALVWGSSGGNEVTRSECKGKSQQFPWQSLLSAEVVFDLDFMLRMLWYSPPSTPRGCLWCYTPNSSSKGSHLQQVLLWCAYRHPLHPPQFPRALREVSVYCCPLWCLGLAWASSLCLLFPPPIPKSAM